jgi:hypothetical protein
MLFATTHRAVQAKKSEHRLLACAQRVSKPAENETIPIGDLEAAAPSQDSPPLMRAHCLENVILLQRV